MEQVARFLFYTKLSGYFIGNLRIHGPGEPLLWEHLNEALPLIRKSGVIGTIFVATNGINLEYIDEKCWDAIDEIRVSKYKNFKPNPAFYQLLEQYKDKIIFRTVDQFKTDSLSFESSAPIPCRCGCRGPMLYGDHVFFYCGPPVFGAAEKLTDDVYAYPELYTTVGKNYMERYDKSKMGSLEFCRYCWANTNVRKKDVAHNPNRQ
jgi:hypothetical protein